MNGKSVSKLPVFLFVLIIGIIIYFVITSNKNKHIHTIRTNDIRPNDKYKKQVHFGTERTRLFDNVEEIVIDCWDKDVKSKDASFNLNDYASRTLP